MQCRAIARRSEHGSITLLGDLAQGTAPWAARDWRDTLAHLGKPDARVVPLTVGFRVPARGGRARQPAAAGARLSTYRRRCRCATTARSTSVPVADLAAATVAEVRAALGHDGSVGGDRGRRRGRRAARGARRRRGARPRPPTTSTAAARVTVVPATLAKGLEYDHVVVVEPAAIVAAEPRGLHRLYVVLTRAVSGCRCCTPRRCPARWPSHRRPDPDRRPPTVPASAAARPPGHPPPCRSARRMPIWPASAAARTGRPAAPPPRRGGQPLSGGGPGGRRLDFVF